MAGVSLPYNNGGTLASGDVLSYLPLMSATCPTGGDAIVYRVQGGFFPYTYTWSGSSDKTRTTDVVNNTIISQVEAGNYDNYKNAISDTLFTPYVSMTPEETTEELTYHVEAQDVSGFCTGAAVQEDIRVVNIVLIEDIVALVGDKVVVRVGGPHSRYHRRPYRWLRQRLCLPGGDLYGSSHRRPGCYEPRA